MLVWYLKKEFVDTEPGIEAVTIPYTWLPIGKPADWSAIHESRSMERGGPLIQGLGQTFRLLEGGMVVHGPDAARIVSGDPDSPVRKKIIKLPRHV